MADQQYTRVPVISSWTSKINWTQVVASVIALLVSLGIPVDDSLKVNILTAIPIVQGAATWVFRTWFTKSVTAASL